MWPGVLVAGAEEGAVSLGAGLTAGAGSVAGAEGVADGAEEGADVVGAVAGGALGAVGAVGADIVLGAAEGAAVCAKAGTADAISAALETVARNRVATFMDVSDPGRGIAWGDAGIWIDCRARKATYHATATASRIKDACARRLFTDSA